MRRTILATWGAVVVALLPLASAGAQQTTIGTPNRTAGASFYENIGVNWAVRGNGWFFSFGGGAAPPFGGFDPGAGATFGFAGPNGFLNISAGQGASTTFSSQTPMVTMPNGGFATFNDQSLRPFVTGVVPVVGGAPAFSSVLEERLHRLQTETPSEANQPPIASGTPAPAADSSAERGDLSVAEIKARKAAEKAGLEAAAAAEVARLIEQAAGAIAAGKPAVAKVYLQMAARRATGEQRAEIQKQLESLK
jgi:hypothetical protein